MYLAGEGIAVLIVGGQQSTDQQLSDLNKSQAPLLMATPDRLLTLLQEEANPEGGPSEILKNVQVMIMDEVRMCSFACTCSCAQCLFQVDRSGFGDEMESHQQN